MKLLSSIMALSLLLTACADDKKSEPKKPSVQPQTTKPATVEWTPINYPGAVVIEGGFGKPDFGNESDVKPIWQLFICIKNSDVAVTGRIHVDMNKLGQPAAVTKITSTYPDGRTEITNYSFSSIDLAYSLKSYLLDYPEMQYGYGWGEIEGQVNGRYNYNIANPKIIIGETFSFGFSRGNLMRSSSQVFDTAESDQKTYIRSWLARFGASKSENRLSAITYCEKANKPYVFVKDGQILDLDTNQANAAEQQVQSN